jgi:hypothetical protein
MDSTGGSAEAASGIMKTSTPAIMSCLAMAISRSLI